MEGPLPTESDASSWGRDGRRSDFNAGRVAEVAPADVSGCERDAGCVEDGTPAEGAPPNASGRERGTGCVEDGAPADASGCDRDAGRAEDGVRGSVEEGAGKSCVIAGVAC